MVYFAKWKIVLVLVVCALGLIYAAPNYLVEDEAEGLPSWVPHKKITLGLDLQGGSHLLLEVDTGAVLRERLESVVDSIRTALRGEKIGYTGLGVEGEAAVFRVRDPAEADRARALARDIDSALAVEAADAGTFRITYSTEAARSTSSAPASRPSSARARTASWCRCPACRTRSGSRPSSARPPSWCSASSTRTSARRTRRSAASRPARSCFPATSPAPTAGCRATWCASASWSAARP
jgi:preprotein translocase subunit SecD